MVGGGEILRDEQIYMAHKCANPQKYALPDEAMNETAKVLLAHYKPTDVQLQVWDDLCHVAPTLSFTRPAKHMYRSVAQFSAWALAKAQKRGIDILDDDAISIISQSGSDDGRGKELPKTPDTEKVDINNDHAGQVGKAGDPLPPFKDHMIRQQVTRHGATMALVPETELPACSVRPDSVGVVKESTVKKWLAMKNQWDHRYSSAKSKVHRKIVKDMVAGYHDFGPQEYPPPTALAGRQTEDATYEVKRQKSLGLAIWSLWGSKHDEMTVERQQKADEEPETRVATPADGQGARSLSEIEAEKPPKLPSRPRNRSHRRTVVDENQTGSQHIIEYTPVSQLLGLRREQEAGNHNLLSPDYMPETGVAGKRPFIDGIALPFSLGKEADTASMMTLQSDSTTFPSSRPMSPSMMSENSVRLTGDDGGTREEGQGRGVTEPVQDGGAKEEGCGMTATTADRPGLDTFVTAAEDLPQLKKE